MVSGGSEGGYVSERGTACRGLGSCLYSLQQAESAAALAVS